MKICHEAPYLVKIGKKLWELYMKIW